MHTVVKALLALPLCLLLPAAMQAKESPAPATEVGLPGTEAFTTLKLSQTQTCQIYSHYAVRVTASQTVAGEYLNVFKMTPGADPIKVCTTAASQAVFNLREEEANWLVGISDQYLFIDQGTGPSLRHLVVLDIEKGKRLYESVYEGDFNLDGKRYLSFDKVMKGPADSLTAADKKACPQAPQWRKLGFGAAWITRYRLDLQTGKATPTGKLSCVQIQ